MSYFDYDFAGLAIECGNRSDYVECQFSHALTPIRKVPPSATSGRLVTITPLTTIGLTRAERGDSERERRAEKNTEGVYRGYKDYKNVKKGGEEA